LSPSISNYPLYLSDWQAVLNCAEHLERVQWIRQRPRIRAAFAERAPPFYKGPDNPLRDTQVRVRQLEGTLRLMGQEMNNHPAVKIGVQLAMAQEKKTGISLWRQMPHAVAIARIFGQIFADSCDYIDYASSLVAPLIEVHEKNLEQKAEAITKGIKALKTENYPLPLSTIVVEAVRTTIPGLDDEWYGFVAKLIDGQGIVNQRPAVQARKTPLPVARKG
jgi:hypothetical protein